jgi:phosphatidylserine decarboxylase
MGKNTDYAFIRTKTFALWAPVVCIFAGVACFVYWDWVAAAQVLIVLSVVLGGVRAMISPATFKEALKFGLPPIVVGFLCLIPRWKWQGLILVLLGIFIFYFFRDPDRQLPIERNVVVSPADGHVVEIVDESLDGSPGKRISIFLSIWDVHVQRAPVAGKIEGVVYKPGRFYAALRKSASTENEQNVIYMKSPSGTLVFKQIAGAIARRVLCWKRGGEEVALGERVGMIRFGSRVDVWLQPEAEVVVRRGQMVKGGESILAKWNSTT